ncbi:WG repeat-containing protein [Winogradskyella sp.]|uniref:WG repeat-containing protein n=1 Tax=Winogradskyella sp. TaxID=1883156 RepID=UPI003F6C5B47
MKRALFIFLAIVCLPILNTAQQIDAVDFISPFYDGVAAVKKNDQWAFINNNGDIMVDFRDDLVLTQTADGSYPIFYSGRCLIKERKEGISYFGYIDITGNTIIEPRFLNATNFSYGKALALELIKEDAGENVALEKNIVYYKYVEVVINTAGEIENYINPKGVYVALDKDFLRNPPKITSKRISENLVAKKDENGKWSVIKLNSSE